MDGLRPERDELDRFKSRSGASKPKAKKAKESSKESNGGGRGGASTPLFVGSLALSLVLFGFLGWAYMQQRAVVADLNSQLTEAMDFINQSKLSMARFEGELTEAGASLEEAGSAAEEKLRFLDSEMRKLWGVAGDRNRKAISENKDAIAGLTVQLGQLKDKQVASLEKQLSAQQQVIKEFEVKLASADQAQKKVAQLEKQVSATAGEVSLVRESLEESMAKLRGQVGGVADLKKATSENTKAIASIDASRSQLIERLVGVERRLNELKLQISADKAPSASQN